MSRPGFAAAEVKALYYSSLSYGIDVRIFLLKACARLARKKRISDELLVDAVERAEKGLVDADLGQKLIKQRVAREGQGKRGGFRMLLALERDKRAVFLFGFAKKDKDNLEQDELEAAHELAKAWLALPDAKVRQALTDGQIIEVLHDDAADVQETLAPQAGDDGKR